MKNDLISRQEVLKLLHALPPEEAMTKAMLIQSVKQMDAAQPEKRTDKRTEIHACDLIDRRAAIGAIFGRSHEIIKMRIGNLPSAQPYTDEEIQKMQDIEQAQLDKAYEMGKADAMAEIIHCKDCIYRSGRYCHYRYTNGLFISADHYCGFAKRQEDDK